MIQARRCDIRGQNGFDDLWTEGSSAPLRQLVEVGAERHPVGIRELSERADLRAVLALLDAANLPLGESLDGGCRSS